MRDLPFSNSSSGSNRNSYRRLQSRGSINKSMDNIDCYTDDEAMPQESIACELSKIKKSSRQDVNQANSIFDPIKKAFSNFSNNVKRVWKEDELMYNAEKIESPIISKPLSIKITIKLQNFTELSIGDLVILTAISNGKLPVDVKDNDYIELTLEGNNNGVYQIVSIGSENSPWVLQKC